MKKKFRAVEIEIKANESKREIEAYASTFGNVDLGGDIVEKGAFKKTIAERWNGGTKNGIKVLWQHMPSMPLGLPVHLEEDSKGLYTVSKISKTDWGDRALQLAIDKVVDKMSIGYNVVKDNVTEKARHLKELKLFEYSLVTFPMNEEADVLGAKSMEQFSTLLDMFGQTNLVGLVNDQKTVQQNAALIKNAIEALNEVLAVANLEPDKSTQKSDFIDQIDPDDVQSILSEIKALNKHLK